MRLILGSQSPRRIEILSFFSYPFEQISPPFSEEHHPFTQDPAEYALTFSKAKAASLAPKYPNAVILTADTLVYHQSKIFNKPTTEEEGLEMLKALQGSSHSVYTAVTVQHDQKQVSDYEQTKVYFHAASESNLKLYQQAFGGLDKAGNYGIQRGGSVIVKKIEGCFYNVMGFPLNTVQRLLQQFGIDLWHYLRS